MLPGDVKRHVFVEQAFKGVLHVARKAVLVTDYRSGLRELAIDVKGVAPDAECKVTIHDFERNLETVKTKLDGGHIYRSDVFSFL